MKKYIRNHIFIVELSLILFWIIGCNYREDKVDNINFNENVNIQRMEALSENNIEINNIEDNKEKLTEEELYSFSTKILAKEENRVNNIVLACSTINNTVIESGEIFSFWEIIGNPTIEKGYKEAKSFTSSGGVTTSIGGGLCQVSSTIYDVVLNIKDLKTVERHQHSREVYYVKLGDDASVSYGSADFRFKNNLPNKIKIYADASNEAVNIRFVKLI